MSSDDEFPPLWPPVFHETNLHELEKVCVVDFSLSTTRKGLFEAFSVVFSVLAEEGIEGEIWLDGSFVTSKPDPADIDFLLISSSEFFDNATHRQKGIIEALIDGNLWELPFLCDTNFLAIDDLNGASQPLEFYKRRFGISVHNKTPKGIARIRLGRSDER